jgi:hypothetical protein
MLASARQFLDLDRHCRNCGAGESQACDADSCLQRPSGREGVNGASRAVKCRFDSLARPEIVRTRSNARRPRVAGVWGSADLPPGAQGPSAR